MESIVAGTRDYEHGIVGRKFKVLHIFRGIFLRDV
jgi:hypothetical protein